MKEFKVTVARLCEISGITRQGYYKERKQRRHQQFNSEMIIDLIGDKRARHPRMGGRKLHHELSETMMEKKIFIGRDKLFNLLKENRLLVKPKRRGTKTTDSRHNLPMYRNLIKELETTAPHQLWISDITYLQVKDKWVYLSLVTDAHSRQIVGWNVGENLESGQSVKALEMAIKQLPSNRWPIHHSDRGSQYCCHEYTAALKARDLPISMTEENHCYENSKAERVNGILKDEYNLDMDLKSLELARQAVEQTIYLYNNERPHLSLQMRKPAQVHGQAA